MLNQAVIVGRVSKKPETIKEGENSVTILTLNVNRPYENEKGEFDIDCITCLLWKGVGDTVTTYIKEGDIVGVKGRLQSKEISLDENTSYTTLQLLAEKVTFLSSKQPNETNED